MADSEKQSDMVAVGKKEGGPLLGTIWFFSTLAGLAVVSGLSDSNIMSIPIGSRATIALVGYLIMQVGLWYTENKWDEEGSAAWLEAANADKNVAPEELEKQFASSENTQDIAINEDKLKAAFPIPWGFLVGWWVWGLSYLFPIDGTMDIAPTAFGIVAVVVSFGISFVASIPMSQAVMNRNGDLKMKLSLMFLLGWILLGVMSALDVTTQMDVYNYDTMTTVFQWLLCMLGPFTIILSQKILFASRKMGTAWEASGAPNFHPIVYNMGGPLFVFGWFILWLGTCGIPGTVALPNIYPVSNSDFPPAGWLPLYLNWRTLVAFFAGTGMVPIVRFLDYSHDEDGKWCGENDEGKVFGKWWLGTDGTYFGLFLESPWPFVIMWSLFGFSSFFAFDDTFDIGAVQVIILVNCVLQGVDAGILIQQNLYAGNADGKNKFSLPFAVLFLALAFEIGLSWNWAALALSLPGAILIILGQKTVFGARKRGDYTLQNGKANPYDQVFVYSWGEIMFMMGWILICWGMSMPNAE